MQCCLLHVMNRPLWLTPVSIQYFFIYRYRSTNYNLPPLNSTSNGLNLETGIFTAPAKRNGYLVTLTAHLANTDKNVRVELSSYAQLFILKNGNLDSLQGYLLVDQGKLADLRLEVNMEKGDTLEVFVGHHMTGKSVYGPSGTYDSYDGFFLEEVRFCIF